MRPSWPDYFIRIARVVATRATCPRASVGCVLTREKRILTTGYNGAPRGVAHCADVGCRIVDNHCQRAVHAEANAVVQAALHGVNINSATAYLTMHPCVNCVKLLISAGITEIVYADAYADPVAEELCCEAGVTLTQHVVQTDEPHDDKGAPSGLVAV
jgi:dCMP deaminase